MAEKSKVFKQVIKSVGFWNYKELYNFCYNWWKDEGYKIEEGNYTEKISDFGKEIILEWTIKRKISDYFKHEIKMKWHILGMKDAEVEINGTKEKTNKGEVKITVDSSLVRDYEETWDKTPTWKFLRGVYDKYVIRTRIDEYEDRLESISERFAEDTKDFLRLQGKR